MHSADEDLAHHLCTSSSTPKSIAIYAILSLPPFAPTFPYVSHAWLVLPFSLARVSKASRSRDLFVISPVIVSFLRFLSTLDSQWFFYTCGAVSPQDRYVGQQTHMPCVITRYKLSNAMQRSSVKTQAFLAVKNIAIPWPFSKWISSTSAKLLWISKRSMFVYNMHVSTFWQRITTSPMYVQSSPVGILYIL